MFIGKALLSLSCLQNFIAKIKEKYYNEKNIMIIKVEGVGNMSNMELEMKIKNVNEKDLIERIEKLGGKYISKSNQFLYVYDLMYVNQRYYANLYELNNETNELRKHINLKKIENLFFEIDQLLSNEDNVFLKNNFNVENLSSIFKLPIDKIQVILNNKILNSFLDKFKITPKKWIRLRKTVETKDDGATKELITLTIKHILKNDESGIQQMKETEILVNSLEETNELLENLGFSYRSYQEKRRVKYILNEHEIDIDTWPGLPTYFEVEGKDKADLSNILNLLGYSFEDAVSCTVDEIYKEIGMDINNMKELKF